LNALAELLHVSTHEIAQDRPEKPACTDEE
jgi:hypothetical protein